jgi:hypothetical protein
VSWTLTLKNDDAGCDGSLVVEHVTTVVPSGNVLPLAGEHPTFNGDVTASVALALKVTTAPAGDVASAT